MNVQNLLKTARTTIDKALEKLKEHAYEPNEPVQQPPVQQNPAQQNPAQQNDLILKKGERWIFNDSPSLTIHLGCETQINDIDIDISVFMLTAKKKVRSEEDFIFYNQPNSSCGSVKHLGDNKNKEVIQVHLQKVPQEISHLIVCATVHDADIKKQDFSQIRNIHLCIDNNTSKKTKRFDLTEKYEGKTALIVAEIYRHDTKSAGLQWRIKPTDDSYNGSIKAMCDIFGIVL